MFDVFNLKKGMRGLVVTNWEVVKNMNGYNACENQACKPYDVHVIEDCKNNTNFKKYRQRLKCWFNGKVEEIIR